MDKKHLAKLKRKQRKAIERWFETYSDSLYTFAYYRVEKDANLAADIVQETFISAIRQIKLYDPQKGSMYTWLTWLSKNYITKALRIKGKHISYEQIWGNIDSDLVRCFEQIATTPLPEDIFEQKETAQLVQMTLANIPANYNKVLSEYYFHQKPIKEIASMQGLSHGAIKAMLHRARKAFKEAFLRLSKTVNTPYQIEEQTNG